ncbi:UNVERIFIED_CONTAM: Aluminum-activated malate transporter 8 [Sesamum calycinum]|uniref:Aluminum-activated malate transporter 8 n=1 Tax=Sesamum calycinum TaxID=2727403 RepID=A0AAW2NT07_9LAMI
MEMNSITYQENTRSCIGCLCDSLKAMLGKFKAKVMEIVKQTKKIGEDDPRRMVHAIKVGLALTFVSLFYYIRPLYDGFGQAGMWAILTVVVVFEFTVGGTLSKSINRGCATLIAGALGVGAEYLANLCGEKGQPFVLGVLVFILGETEIRLWSDDIHTNIQPSGGVGFPSHHQFAVSLSKDLHYLIAGNVEKLATFLEGFGGELFSCPGDESRVVECKDDKEKSVLQIYKSVVNSKAAEESLVASEFQLKIQSTCKNMSIECSKALKELSSAVKNMTFPSPAANIHIQNSIATADDFKRILENSSLSTKTGLQEIMPVLVTASVLIDIIRCVEKISVSIDELSQKAGFRKPIKSLDKQLLHRGIVKPVNDHVVLEISETGGDSVDNKKLHSGIVKLVDGISGGNDHIVVKINELLEDSVAESKNPRPSQREQ